jgi:hypothetical protein
MQDKQEGTFSQLYLETKVNLVNRIHPNKTILGTWINNQKPSWKMMTVTMILEVNQLSTLIKPIQIQMMKKLKLSLSVVQMTKKEIYWTWVMETKR